MLEYERQHWNETVHRLAGVDEAGRGPLAGPVVAASIVFEKSFIESEWDGILKGVNDSKKISEKRRDYFFGILRETPGIEIGVGIADYDEIDRDNILNATHSAMNRSIKDLAEVPDHIMVDGLPVEGFPCESTAIVGGDSKSISIACASIIAKVLRDNLMRQLDCVYPQYGFAKHKGYGTKDHMAALKEHGPSPVHRMSFRPVREAAERKGMLGS